MDLISVLQTKQMCIVEVSAGLGFHMNDMLLLGLMFTLCGFFPLT